MAELNDQQAQFVVEYLKDFNGTQAAIRAGYSARTAHAQASRLLRDVKVQGPVLDGVMRLRESAMLDAENVTRIWAAMALVDRNEIAEVRRVCCAFCYSPNGLPMETVAERWYRHEKWKAQQAVAEARFRAANPAAAMPEWPPFDERGGTGYDPRKVPDRNCVGCFGEGETRIHVHDTRNLSPAAKLVYEGIEIKNGEVVVSMHSREKALDMIARRLGILNDRAGGVNVNVFGPHTGPRNVTPGQMPDDPQEASRYYQQLIEGAVE